LISIGAHGIVAWLFCAEEKLVLSARSWIPATARKPNARTSKATSTSSKVKPRALRPWRTDSLRCGGVLLMPGKTQRGAEDDVFFISYSY
jgi:hypothetical protein